MSRLALIAFAAVLAALPARAAELGDFLGIWVGVSEDFDGNGHQLAERHVDMVITEAGSKGFRIELTSVVLVDGRRDVEGVRRRAYTAEFGLSDNGRFYVAKEAFDPFEERKSTEMLAGEPLEWAQIDGSSLVVYTFAVLDDGRYEAQVYERALDGNVMQTVYERRIDGALERQTAGQMVRSD